MRLRHGPASPRALRSQSILTYEIPVGLPEASRSGGGGDVIRFACVAGLVASALLVTSCGGEDDASRVSTDIPFRADGVVEFLRPDSTLVTRIAVEIARSDSARARGLMQRRRLPSRGGMLFVDEEPQEQRFWMENTPIPLDMIFIDAHGRVLNVERARPFSRENVVSAGPALYNIEVRAGFAERHGITEGVLMRWWEVE